MEVLIIIVLILLNGIFAMSEIAVVSARKTSLSNEARQGSKSAQRALDLANNPDQFLSTVQVGITLIGILTGLYSGDVLAGHFSPVLESIGVPHQYALPISQVIIVVVVTYLTIIFGELVPKRIGMSASVKIAKIIARPMIWLSVLVTPFVWILSKSTSFVSNLLGIRDNNSKMTEEEIKQIIKESAEGGEVQAVEQDIVERVFSLGDRDMESIMTPRSEVIWLDVSLTKDELKEKISKYPFDKYPVADNDLDNIEGLVLLKDIFANMDNPDFSLRKICRQASFFYETMQVYPALDKMKETHSSMVLIGDEFGAVSGLVTMKDILEALVGEILEINEEPEIVERKDGSFLVDGRCSFYNFLDYFEMEEIYSKYDYNTLSGLILDLLGRIPKTGDTLQWHVFSMEIVDMDGARIDKVLVRKEESVEE